MLKPYAPDVRLQAVKQTLKSLTELSVVNLFYEEFELIADYLGVLAAKQTDSRWVN